MNYVFVIDSTRKALAPCHPARARELLRKKKAAVLRMQPFTIILKHQVTAPINKNFSIKIDPGSKATGIAVISHGKRGSQCIVGIVLEHRGSWIKKCLEQRRNVRRHRRYRNVRFRSARFNNRKRIEGWLPPSVIHRFYTTRTWINRILRFSSVSKAMVEIVKFDTQKLENPNIQGKEYQQGPLFGTEMREYLLYKYDHTCQYCKGLSKDKILEWEHKVPKSKGGSDSLNNATLACKKCNQLKGNLTVKEFYEFCNKQKSSLFKTMTLNLKKVIDGKNSSSLRDAAVMNAIRNKLEVYFNEIGFPVTMIPGWVTKRNRIDQGYRKSHWIDAACLGEPGDKVYIPNKHQCLTVKAMGHGSRQMVQMDKYGFPRINKKTKKQSVKGPSRVYGFKTGDLVKANIPKGKYEGVHVGRVVVRERGSFQINGIDTNYKNVIKLQSTDGYKYSYGDPVKEIAIIHRDDDLKRIVPYPFSIVNETTEGDKIKYVLMVNKPNLNKFK